MCEAIVGLGLDADLVFMDDNSPDGTGRILDALAVKHPRVSVIHRAGKSGIGSAHYEGIHHAYDRGYQRLVTLDCDFTHFAHHRSSFLDQSPGTRTSSSGHGTFSPTASPAGRSSASC